MNNWQSIETAPKDRCILAYRPDPYKATIFIVEWSNIYEGFCVLGTYREAVSEYSDPEIMIIRPTHWMALPEPPE